MSKTGENQTQNTESTQANAPAPSAPAFKIKGHVVLPLLKWTDNVSKYLKITGPIHVGKEIQEKGATKKKEPAHLMEVIDLETGEAGEVIVATVLRGILTENFPDETYIGRGFRIMQRKIPGKDYNGFDVDELDLG